MMKNGERKGQIFQFPPSHKYWNIFLARRYIPNFIFEDMKVPPENPEYAEIRHGDVILTLQ